MTTPVRVYLGGPMRGYERYNFDQFFEAEEVLTRWGYTVVSPARHDVDMGFDPDRDLEDQPTMEGGRFDIIQAFRWDLQQVIDTDATILLPAWERSSGASLECAVAQFVGRPVGTFPTNELNELVPVTKDKTPETVLEEAARIVDGDRMQQYGHPLDDFTATAAYWQTWIHHKYGIWVPFEAVDVGWMQSLLKHSREGNKKKRDNKVDVAGYIRTVEKVEDEEERRAALANTATPVENGYPGGV